MIHTEGHTLHVMASLAKKAHPLKDNRGNGRKELEKAKVLHLRRARIRKDAPKKLTHNLESHRRQQWKHFCHFMEWGKSPTKTGVCEMRSQCCCGLKILKVNLPDPRE